MAGHLRDGGCFRESVLKSCLRLESQDKSCNDLWVGLWVSCSLFSRYLLAALARSDAYVNVRQGHIYIGDIYLLAQTSAVSLAFFPLRIPTCLPGLLGPHSCYLLLSPEALIFIPLSVMMFTNEAGCSLTAVGQDQLMLSVFSSAIAKAAAELNPDHAPRRPEYV